MQINVKHLSYTYNSDSPFAAHALRDVSLSIEEGEFFGIIGHTGSGKSTFVQHLNALLRVPTSLKKYRKKRGAAESDTVLSIGEYDLTKKDTDFFALRSRVGMVMQYPEYQLFAETVFEDVAFGYKNFCKEKPSDDAVESAVRDAVTIVGLNYEEIKNVSPFDLSGGQKRRVAIAGVIVTKPEILILDEPAAGLDPLGKQEIMSLLHALHKTWCKTIIIVSHDMDEVAENCSRVAVFADGTVKYVLPPKELFSHADELLALGLDIPLTAKICRALQSHGIHIDCDFTERDFVEKVLAYPKGGDVC